MALRAGYVGIKKTMTGMIEKLSSAKIIKTIGNGLKLTSAGTLSCEIDSNTMEFKNGKLAAKATALDYSETEVDTGIKWIDGKTIYAKSYFKDSSIPASNTSFDTIADLDNLIDAKGSITIGGNTLSISFKASASGCFPQIMTGGNVTLSYTGSVSKFNLTLYYTKTEQEE